MILYTDKITLRYCIIGMVIIGDILPIINNGQLGGTLSTGILIAPYLIAAYIKKYNINISSIYSILLILGGYIFQIISMYFLNILHKNPYKFIDGIFPLISAIGIFFIVLKLPYFCNPIINFFSTSVLAAYLITMNKLIYQWFWTKLLDVGKFQNSVWFTFIGLGISLLIILLCCLFDKISKFLFNNLQKINILK